MKDNTKIFALYLGLLAMILLLGMTCSAQTVVNDKTFNKTQSGITIVEFWADWNKGNECSWIKDIKDASSFRIDLVSETAKKYDIKVLPTLIVFNNGEEIERFEGNISFQLCPKRTPKKVKKIVSNLMIDKF